MHRCLASPGLLNWASGRAAKTRAEDLGELTISMLRGEQGNQVRELQDLIGWLSSQHKPDVICLSNALLLGLARQLRSELSVPIVCSLQGEDAFLDGLPESSRARAWEVAQDRSADVDLFIAPSRYYGKRMQQRLNFPEEKLRVVYNGIDLSGYEISVEPPRSPTIGFFARMCSDKGLDKLVDAFIELRKRNNIPNVQLKIGGSYGSADERFVADQRRKLEAAKLLDASEFHPNLSRVEKIAFLKSLSVFSVPTTYGEAFGLYVIEALAAGVPVVQPRHAAFPELVEKTGGGVLFNPGDITALTDSLESLLLDPTHTRAIGEVGRNYVFAHSSAAKMAEEIAAVCTEAARQLSNRKS
jgi:glycosyltransferase involved in cell wall biosynthesis